VKRAPRASAGGVIAIALLLASWGGCSLSQRSFLRAAPTSIDRSSGKDAIGPAPRTVVLISVDGLAPWVLDTTPTPRLDALARQGTRALRAETVQPPRTLPSHVSMISGLEPAVHGVTWNRWLPFRRVSVATLFTGCRRSGLRCSLFATKLKFAHLAEDEAGVERYRYFERSDVMLDAAADYLIEKHPAFLMLHLAEVDLVGHAEGWGSPAQRRVIEQIDAWLGAWLDRLGREEGLKLTLLVTSDHGGEGRTHYGSAPEHVRIPWIAWGDGVQPGGQLEFVKTVDTAATIGAWLELSPETGSTH